LCVALLSLSAALAAQSSKGTVRHHRVQDDESVSQQVLDAESALDKKDYEAAEKLLLSATAAKSQDYRAWFDLGRVYESTGLRNQAITAFQHSVAAKPQFFEANFKLGLMLASSGNSKEAAASLRAATALTPANPESASDMLYAAWLGLGKALENDAPADSVDAYQHALKMHPDDFDAHLGMGRSLEGMKALPQAAVEYQHALAAEPSSTDALRHLVNVYIASNQFELAESSLRDYLKLQPASAEAHLQMGRLLVRERQYDEALAELQTAQSLAPGEIAIRREIAGLAATQKKYDVAEAQYRELVKASSNDADLHYALGTVLMDQHKFADAEPELIAAVQLDPRLGDAYGNLALVASENQHYELAVKALDARSRLLPENPGSWFLRATSFDHMHQWKQAVESYHRFLDLAQGKFPDQEWQARQRLITLERK